MYKFLVCGGSFSVKVLEARLAHSCYRIVLKSRLGGVSLQGGFDQSECWWQ